MIAGVCGLLAAEAMAVEPSYSLERQWAVKEFSHDPRATTVFHRENYLYTGGNAPEGKIAKVEIGTGAVAWSYPTGNSYQPSSPVSNGEVVVFGTYYTHALVGLSDRTGALRWTIPTADQNMSDACFADDLVFIGSYDRNLYAINWADGKVKWKTPLGNLIWSRPCIHENWVIVGCIDGNLYGLDRQTGKVEVTIPCGGKVEANPLVSHGLLFILVDAQKYTDSYQASNIQRTMLVIDLQQRKIVSRFPSARSFSHNVIVSGDDVFFGDEETLYSYDAGRAVLSWKKKAPPGMLPYPMLTASQVILAMNQTGFHGEHSTKVLVLARRSGEEMRSQDHGGIALRQAHYVQSGNRLVTVEFGLVGYQLQPPP